MFFFKIRPFSFQQLGGRQKFFVENLCGRILDHLQHLFSGRPRYSSGSIKNKKFKGLPPYRAV